MSQRFPVDNDALEDFALRMIGVRSYSTEEADAAAVLHAELTRHGFEVTVDELGNVIGTLRLGDGPVVLLDTHLDTVGVLDASEWSRKPDGEVAGGRIFGRGAVDIKGPMAACVYGVSALRNHAIGTVVISGSVAEELVEGPALLRVLEAVKPDFVVICEPSSGKLARGQRGRAEVLVEVAGRSCHSAYPDSGINAAEVMVDVITALRALTPPQQPTLGEGILVLTDVMSHPYPGLSVVPERCVATFDRRTLVGESEAEVLAPIRAIVDEVTQQWGTNGSVTVACDDYVTYTGVQVQAPNFAPAWLANEDAPIVAAAVAGLTDVGLDATVTHYKFCTNGSASAGQLGIPTIGYGPGHEDEAHTVNESISLLELHDGAQGYAAIVASLLSYEESPVTTTDARRCLLSNENWTGEISAVDSSQVLEFHRSLPAYATTSLISSPDLAARLGVAEVWVKDESNRLGMPSFKILGASYATFMELCGRAGVDPARIDGLSELRSIVEPLGLTLVAATDGNHGRAVARMAAYLGLAAHILVPQDMVPARIAALEGEGARVTIVSGNYDDAVAQSARLQDERTVVVSDTSWEGYEQVPGWVIDGYATIGVEVHAQLEALGVRPPTVVAAQIGVGAFAAAVVRSFVPDGARVVGVEPTKADCVLQSVRAGRPIQISGALDSIMAGLNCGSPSPVAWTDVFAGIDTFVAVDDADAKDAMRALARVGVVAGESGAAGLAGLLAFSNELNLRSDDRILVISTEGATDPHAYDRIVGRP